ncbi:acetate/propionate family kinase [Planctomycetota bacterium]
MIILVLNSGSSTIKYKLFDQSRDYFLLTGGSTERIGLDNSFLRNQKHGCQEEKIVKPLADYKEALKAIFEILRDDLPASLKSGADIDAVGHRVVHGGSEFLDSTLVNEDVTKSIMDNSRFAPLHNPANAAGIALCEELLPNIPNVVVFDTSLYQTIPTKAFLYGLPLELYEKHRIRKYGFQGISHSYVYNEAIRIIGKPLEKLKIITCHLGNGCSITAFDRGKSVDTSMGMTPLEGLLMATRSGDIDPAVVLYLMKYLVLSSEEVGSLLNKKSGLLGLCGQSDMRDVLEAAEKGDERAKTAIEIFVYRIQKYIGAYVAALNGLDVIVFTAGIGENCPGLRTKILENFGYLGIEIDETKNRENATLFSTPKSRVHTMTIPTNEELVIARETHRIITEKKFKPEYD